MTRVARQTPCPPRIPIFRLSQASSAGLGSTAFIAMHIVAQVPFLRCYISLDMPSTDRFHRVTAIEFAEV